jgi:hypothetical protein
VQATPPRFRWQEHGNNATVDLREFFLMGINSKIEAPEKVQDDGEKKCNQ